MNDHGIVYRDYQIEARDAAFREFESGKTESTLVVMPTGSGKTVLAGMCVEYAKDKHDKPTLFVAHREQLIDQAASTMTAFGFSCAVEMGSRDARSHVAALGHPDVVVGSIQTLQDDRLMRWAPDSFGLIIIDECHRALANSYTKTLNWFRDYWLIGITATPKRGDERNLGARFKTKAYQYGLRRAIQSRWLVPIKTRECRVSVDLRGIKMFGGDLSNGELEERIGPRIEALARGFIKEVGEKPAVVFTPDVGSAMAFAQVCTDLGTPTRYVAGTGGAFGMTKAERKANLDAFNANEYQIIVCCELLVEGWDCPKIEAVGILRPTKQQYRYTQMVGRGTRPCPSTGKTECLVIDFDWQTDKENKDLCTTVELFDDGSIDEEVFAVARELASKCAVDVDPLEMIEEAERIIRTRTKFMVTLTGREETYAALEYDPIGVSKLLDINLNRKYDLDKRGTNPASDKQTGMLRSLGIDTPEGLSKWGASKMIDKLMKRKKEGLASMNQVKAMLMCGVNTDIARSMSVESATAAIIDLQRTAVPKQRQLFT